MIYLVTRQKELFVNTAYTIISVEESLKMMRTWNRVQFDSETNGKDPHIAKILCIQFGNKKSGCQIVVDITTIDIKLYKNILENKPLIGQNLKFDLQFLFSVNIVPLKVYDTMIVEQLLYLGYPPGAIRMSLNAIAERRLGINIDKTVRGEIIWRGLDTSVIVYAAGDVMYLEDIMDLQLQDCSNRGCLIGARLECDFVPVISYLEWCGIRLDTNAWNVKMSYDNAIRDIYLKSLNDMIIALSRNEKTFTTYISHYGKEEDDISKERKSILKYSVRNENKDITTSFGAYFEAYDSTSNKKLLGDYYKVNNQGDLFLGYDTEPKCTVNWNSGKQVIEILKELGFDTKVKDKKTGETKDSALEKVIRNQKGICDPFLYIYFNYKEASKVCSTYGQAYIDAINPITDRIHTIFRQLGASSGRMSCGASKQKNTDLAKYKKLLPSLVGYVQLQNLPSDHATRASFVPKKGNKMVSADYSAMESRLGADIYNEKSMIEEFLHGSGDIHSLVAKACFPELKDVTIKSIKKDFPHLRSRAKPIGFSQQFGGSASAIKSSLGCTIEEANDIANLYNSGFPGIYDFKLKGSKFVKENGYILICKYTGHKIYWHDWKEWTDRQATFTSSFWEIYRQEKEIYLAKVAEYENSIAENKKMPKKPPIMELVSYHFKAGSKWDRLALNSPTQGTGIILLKEAMINFFHWIVKNGYFNIILLCNLVHDEVVAEYPENLEVDVAEKIVYFMEEAASKYCKSLPIPAVAEVGDHWIH